MTPVRSPNPSNANNERNVNPDGSLNNNNANNTNGVSGDRENVRSSKQKCRKQSTHTGDRLPDRKAKMNRVAEGQNALPGRT